MDIRKIIDPDDAPAPRKPSIPSPAKQEHLSRPTSFHDPYGAQAPIYDNRRDIRPPQPSPLQTPGYNDLRYHSGSSQNTMHSPYRQTPPSSFSGGQYQSPQHPNRSPANSRQNSQYPQPEGHSASGLPSHRSLGHSTPLSQTPTTTSTPGSASAYSSFPRPTSSHSVTTPQTTQQLSTLLRESPKASHDQLRSLSQPQTSPQYVSQPATPLGPPSTYGRSGFNLHRESLGTSEHRRSLSGGSYGQPQATAVSPATAESPPTYGARQSQPGIQSFNNTRERDKSLSVSPKTRLPSMPRVGSLDGSSDQAFSWPGQVTPAKRKAEEDTSYFAGRNGQQMRQAPARAASFAVNGLLNAESSAEATKPVNDYQQTQMSLNSYPQSEPVQLGFKSNSTRLNQSAPQIWSTSHTNFQLNEPPLIPKPLPTQHSSTQPQTPTPPASNQTTQDSVSPLSSHTTMQRQVKAEALAASNGFGHSPSKPAKKRALAEKPIKQEIQQPSTFETNTESEFGQGSSSQPARKRPRLEESSSDILSATQLKHSPYWSNVSTDPLLINTRKKYPQAVTMPIYAHCCSDYKPWNPNGKDQPMHVGTEQRAPTARQVPITGPGIAQPSGQQSFSGHAPATNGMSLPIAQPAMAENGPLGPWEPSITNILPSEDLVKVVADWLFAQVVVRNDVGVGPAGGAAGQGAILEIEAKIGHLIDKNTNDRLRLPVITECVISKDDPNLRIAFKSSMTEAQHRTLNGFLNKALLNSQPTKTPTLTPPPKPRIPMNYKHTYECDTFYELSQSGVLALPPSISANFNNRQNNKAKVRITTDQKSGKELAKIVKARIADIDIHSPRTLFDWRISVNLEMNFEGDMKDLVEADRRDGKRADRNKDRMSYKHLAYQIDLTQVTPADATSKTEKEHELEIEVSSAEVRRQGQLAQQGQVHQYEELIRGFLDNVRTLVRHCQ